jgi:hypothetical protein
MIDRLARARRLDRDWLVSRQQQLCHDLRLARLSGPARLRGAVFKIASSDGYAGNPQAGGGRDLYG